MKSEAGFTLISTIMAVLITVLTVSMLYQGTYYMLHLKDPLIMGKKEVWVFLEQIKKDIHASKTSQCQDDQLVLDINNSQVEYQRSGQRLFRTVNGRGYEIVLQNIQTIHFTCKVKSVEIALQDHKNKNYQWSIIRYIE